MRRVALEVDTLRCEADEAAILDEVLAQEGVLAAEVDLASERVSLAFDEHVTTKAALLGHLRFFGLTPRPARPL
ncbi:MAG TPA: heavy metal-associated domain-containing protein [Candidatus Thermoplasmatota archaeon]|nr:heavy metal-associated domain-containing protein [Candidatus Thermoplasmatota archaeon]